MNYSNFKFFIDWFVDYRCRNDVAIRRSTKISQQIIFSSLSLWFACDLLTNLNQFSKNYRAIIINWFQFNRRNFQSLSNQISQYENERFMFCNIDNMNQTFIFYEFLNERCYDFKKIKIVWIKQIKNDWKKKCVILMIYIFANDFMRCKSLFIFKNKSDEKNIKIKNEMKKYHFNVKVLWNDKIYCNNEIMCYWLKHMYKYVIFTFVQNKFFRLLSLDVFSNQKISEIKQIFKNLNVTFFFVFSDCTNYVQIFDVTINKSFKARISIFANEHYEQNIEKWIQNKWTTNERRVLFIKWINQAWEKFHKNQKHVIVNVFRSFDFSFAIDDSKNHEIKIKNIDNFEINDWRLSIHCQQKNVFNVFDFVEQRKKKRNVKSTRYINEYVHNDEKNVILNFEIDEENNLNSNYENSKNWKILDFLCKYHLIACIYEIVL